MNKDIIQWFYDAGVYNISEEPTVCNDTNPDNIQTLEQLKQVMEQVDCDLKNTAQRFVFGDGNPHADILFLGEAPGADEDKQGVPFVGQAGQLLNKAINAIGLQRQQVYITNIIPWRPIGNRTPTSNEIELYRPYMLRHVSIVHPQIIVCLGSTAMKAVFQQNIGISKMRGTIKNDLDIFGYPVKILVTFHPAYLLRSPSQKKNFWWDFIQIKKALDTLTGKTNAK